MKSAKGTGVKRLKREEADAIMEAIRQYRFFAGQLSNVCFNLAQKALDHDQEKTMQLVRDFDKAELNICLTLKEAQLYKRLDDVPEQASR